MIRSIRRCWGVPRIRAFVLLVSVAIASPVAATEPGGRLQLQADWVQANADEGPLVVRLRFRSLVALDETTLTVSTPVGFVLRSLTPSVGTDFRTVPAAQDRLAIRAGLQSLVPAVRSTLDFELVLPPGGNGTLEFIVEGRDRTGRKIRNAIGLAVSEEGFAGAHRLGAVEFPAVVLPSTEKR